MNFKKHLQEGKVNLDLILLVFIIVVGTVLRFWYYDRVPFTYDEFSAFFRLRFDNFTDLIQQGVKVDAHPAGVHVLMYYWSRWFGDSAQSIKLPFVIFGMLSIPVAYLIGKKSFNPMVGLIAAMFIAFLQYPVTYSVIARPYISGMFFSLLMVWFWMNIFFGKSRHLYGYLFAYIGAASAAAYNHHFSLLLVGLVGISGLFFVTKINRLAYFLSNVIIFILYIPHLPIFATQFGYGGVEQWLGKPNPDFIINYLKYILHFSPWMYFVFISLLILSGVFFTKKMKKGNQLRILFLSWFLISYFTGYFYSVYVNAVLQFSVLIFVFPFLVIFLFSFIRNVQPIIKIAIVMIFAVVSISTLIIERQHYQQFYVSGYEIILEESHKKQIELGKENLTTVIRSHRMIHEYFMERLNYNESDFNHLDSIGDYLQFRTFLKDQKTDYFILAWSEVPNLEYLKMVEEVYPYLIEKKVWITTNFYLFSKRKEDKKSISPDPVLYLSENTFENVPEGWESPPEYAIKSGLQYKGDKFYKLNSWEGYSPKFEIELDHIIDNENNMIFISVDVYYSDSIASPQLIAVLETENEVIDWRSKAIVEFVDQALKRKKAYLAVKLSDINLKKKNIKFSTYIWNETNSEILLDNYSIEVREGNPLIYGLFEDF
jgi:hypothetical protein